MSALLFALLLAAPKTEDPLPLVLPKVKQKPASQPASAPFTIGPIPKPPPASKPVAHEEPIPTLVKAERTKPRPPPTPPKPLRDSLVQLGAKVFASAGSGPALAGPFGALELAVRLPVWGNRLGVFLEPGAGQLFGRDATLLYVGGPVGASLQQPVGAGLVRFMAGATVGWAKSAHAQYTDELVSFGATGGLAYVFPVGPGGMSIDLRYRALPYLSQGKLTVSHGGTLGIGYAFYL